MTKNNDTALDQEIKKEELADARGWEDTALLPCPFCNNTPIIEPENPKVQGDAWTAIHCPNETCPARSGVHIYEDKNHYKKAAEIWNTRPTAPQNAEALEKIRLASQWAYDQSCKAEKDSRGYDAEMFMQLHFIAKDAALNQPRTVKPLVWNDDGVNGFAYATTPLFFYEISLNDTQTHYTLTCDSDWIGDFKTIEEAKAAAEAHKDKMIREWLE